MFSHVMVGVNDLERSKKFYDALLGAIGVAPGVTNKNRYFYRSPTGTFGITTPINGEPATFANGGTIGFAMQSPEQADAFHAAGVANGWRWHVSAWLSPAPWRATSPGAALWLGRVFRR